MKKTFLLAILLIIFFVGCSSNELVISDTVCTSGSGAKMTLSDAMETATHGCENGTIKDTYFCNDITGTWWIDFEAEEPNELCNPACVVNVETRQAEINWRCTGTFVPEE